MGNVLIWLRYVNTPQLNQSTFSKNVFSEITHLHPYGLSPVWILIWICCELREPNVFPHSLHGNCLPDTLLWLCLWFINDRPSGNSSPHTSHETTLFRWDNMCRFNLALLWKDFAHFEQANIFSLECSQECFKSVLLSLHVRPHNLHILAVNVSPCLERTCAATASSSTHTSPHIMQRDSEPRACTLNGKKAIEAIYSVFTLIHGLLE